MAKKKNRTKRQGSASREGGTTPRKKKRGLNGPSLVFIGLLLIAAVAIAIASVVDGPRPECPPGQVWSDAHNHCH